jgi:hypothetical protein
VKRLLIALLLVGGLTPPALAQLNGSYTESLPAQGCFTFSSGTFVSLTSGACSSVVNIWFDFTDPNHIIALEEELP